MSTAILDKISLSGKFKICDKKQKLCTIKMRQSLHKFDTVRSLYPTRIEANPRSHGAAK